MNLYLLRSEGTYYESAVIAAPTEAEAQRFFCVGILASIELIGTSTRTEAGVVLWSSP